MAARAAAPEEAAEAPVSPPRPTTRLTPGIARRPASMPEPRRRIRDSIADYAYVQADLRRIGIFASSLVVLLVALSFIVR